MHKETLIHVFCAFLSVHILCIGHEESNSPATHSLQKVLTSNQTAEE